MTTPTVHGLRVGFVPGVTLAKWRRIWADRFPRTPLDVAEVSEADQRRILMAGRADMCFVRLPIDNEGIHVIPLYDEVPVVWLSKDHALAELDELTTEDLADERVIADAEPESVELAAYSAAVLRVPMSIARTGNRRDLVHRPVTDAPPTTVGLAWRIDQDNPLVDDFIGVVRGRTPNSSRTEQQRGAVEQPKQPSPKRVPPPKGRAAGARTNRSRRGGPRR